MIASYAIRVGNKALWSILLVSILIPVLTQARPMRKEALVKIGYVWLKVSVEVPAELIASFDYSIPVTFVITEVEGDLRVFYLKGLRFTVDNSVIEYVPDVPLSLTLGRMERVTVVLTPRFFAAQMAPGDVKDTSLRIDISYYYEVTPKGESLMQESGYYSVFASIPVRAIAPRTYFHVQPSMNVSYEPYIVKFFVDVWVSGDGFIENARGEVSGVPVQCYLLTTGRINAGEHKRLEFIMNVSKLGSFARSQYNMQLEVTAITPWGYTYRYSYLLPLSIKPLREVAVSAPTLAVANALTPISVSLNPPLEQDEEATVNIYLGKRLIHTAAYSQTIYVVLPEGEETLTVKVESNKYATSTGKALVKTTTVEPRVSANVIDSVLYFRVAPVYPGARVDVKAVDENGNTAFSTSVSATALSYSPTSVSGASAVEGSGSVYLSLNPGSYTVVVTYNTGTASEATSVQYTVPGAETPLASLPLPMPLLVIVIAGVLIVVPVLTLLRRRGRGEGEGEE